MSVVGRERCEVMQVDDNLVVEIELVVRVVEASFFSEVSTHASI
jgi:hypothetical protein